MKRGKFMSYSQKLTQLKALEEENQKLMNIVSELYEEVSSNSNDETVKELLKKQGYYHSKHNPYSGGGAGTGYFIDEPHPEHEGWFRRKGPYHGD